MKTNLLCRVGAWTLAALMAAGLLASCKKPADEPLPATKEPSSESTEPPEDTDEIFYKPEVTNFDYTLKMAAPSQQAWGTGHYVSANHDATGDVIDTALFRREVLMEEVYGVTLELDTSHGNNLASYLNTTGASGEYFADLIFVSSRSSMLAAQSGYFTDLNQLKSLNLEAPYWDQRIQNDFNIGGKLFHLAGDFTNMDEMVTMVILYNDYLYDAAGYYDQYGTPYEMVDAHTWTYETFMKMCSENTFDLNDDGMNENDRWGAVSECQAVYYFYLGSGMRPVSNEEGGIVLNYKDSAYYQRTMDVLGKLMPEFGLSPYVCHHDRDLPGDDKAGIAATIFAEDRALFRTTSLSAATRAREMVHDFGVLPIPAYFEDQTDYYCWVTGDSYTPLSISRFSPDVEKVAQITEIWCYHSRYGSDSLYNAFYEKMVLADLCRKPEDYKMLQLIFDSKVFDVDFEIRVIDLNYIIRYDLTSFNATSYATKIKGALDAADRRLIKFYEDFMENNP